MSSLIKGICIHTHTHISADATRQPSVQINYCHSMWEQSSWLRPWLLLLPSTQHFISPLSILASNSPSGWKHFFNHFLSLHFGKLHFLGLSLPLFSSQAFHLESKATAFTAVDVLILTSLSKSLPLFSLLHFGPPSFCHIAWHIIQNHVLKLGTDGL